MAESLRGKLILASPVLRDPNFVRTVVLIAEHTDEGAMGLVLNRPAGSTVGEAVPDLSWLAGDTEPVYVGDDSTFASSLVSGLLRGPGRALRGVVTSQLPSGLQVDLSVPVTDGTAAISLTGEASAFSPADTDELFAQLAWTLRQDPDVDAFTLDIDGRAVRSGEGETVIPVEVGDRLDPAGFQTDTLLYGLRDGRLMSGTPGALDPVDGVLGRVALGRDHDVGDRLEPGDLGPDLADRPVRVPVSAEVHRPRAPLLAVEHVEADVGRDPVEPAAEGRAALEAVEAAPRAQERVLHRVLGLERRAEHPVAVRGELPAVALQVVEGDLGLERRRLHDVDPTPRRS